MKFKDLTNKQIFILFLVGFIGIIVLSWIIWLGRIEWTYNISIQMDNNSMEAIKSINWSYLT